MTVAKYELHTLHHAYARCDTEMGKSEIQKGHKEKEVKSLTSKVEEMSAQVNRHRRNVEAS